MTWRRTSIFTDTMTLLDVKEYLRVNHGDDDPLISQLIAASLEKSSISVQKPVLDTQFTDLYGPISTFPTSQLVEDTEAPAGTPKVFYTDPGLVEQELPAANIIVVYVPWDRKFYLTFNAQPDIAPDTDLKVQWDVRAIAPESAIAARKLLIANWYENREASVTGTVNTELSFGVKALLSPHSLVM